MRDEQRTAEIAQLRSELQAHPDDAERWAKLGKATLFFDDAAAVDALEHATRLAPNVGDYWEQLSYAHSSNDANDPKADEHSDAALLTCVQRDPQHGGCRRLLGLKQSHSGEHAAALESFTLAQEHSGRGESLMIGELIALDQLDRADAIVRERLARTPAHAGNFDKLFTLHGYELQIAEQRGDEAKAQSARDRLAEYARNVSQVVAFNLGSTYAISRRDVEASLLLEQYVQNSCGDPATERCDQCSVARDLLARIAKTRP